MRELRYLLMLGPFIGVVLGFSGGVPSAFAHGGGEDPLERRSAYFSMIPLPIQLGLDGSLSWGYGMEHSGHSGHGDMNHGDMDHGDMDHGDMDHGDMDHGDMDHGDMDHGDMEHGDMDQGDMSSSGSMDSSDWMYHIMPMATLSFDYYTRLINLEEQDLDSRVIETSYDSKRFLSIENRILSAGFGAMLMAMPMDSAISNFGLRIGLMPYKGGHVFKAKHVSNRADQGLVSEMRVPLELKNIESWSLSDRITYSTHGGVMFNAGVGFSIFGHGIYSYMAQGDFVVSVSKLSETEVLASINNSSMKMLSKKVGNAVVELALADHKGVGESFQAIFDLGNKSAAKAYREFITGDIRLAQEMYLDKQEGVELVANSKSQMSGKMNRFSFGIPFVLNGTRSSSTMLTEASNHNAAARLKTFSITSMYKKSYDTDGVLSAYRDSGAVFMANTVLEQDRKTLLGYGGSFKWYFQKDRVSNGFFNGQLRRLVNTFGLDQARELAVPTLRNMGFVRAEADILLTQEDVDKMLKASRIKSFGADFKERIYKKLNRFFTSGSNHTYFCGTNDYLRRCVGKTYSISMNVAGSISTHLKNMDLALKNKEYKKFSNAFGRLGKLAMVNRFLFEEIMRLAGKESIGVFKAQGTRIYSSKLKLKY